MRDLETIKEQNARGSTGHCNFGPGDVVPSLNDQEWPQAANNNEPAMNTFRACMIAEGMEPADEPTRIAAWQFLIDSGAVWCLQGS